MKIKEIENQTGVPQANIRYYEKEGLLHPERNRDNNYREYTQEDKERLLQIKMLRQIGIGLGEVKKIYQGQQKLGEKVKERISKIEEEKEELLNEKNICDFILQQEIEIDDLDETCIKKMEGMWRDKSKEFFDEESVILERAEELRRSTGIVLCGVIIAISFLPMVSLGGQTRNAFQLLALDQNYPGILFYSIAGILLAIPVLYIRRLLYYVYRKRDSLFVLPDTFGNLIGALLIAVFAMVLDTSFPVEGYVYPKMWSPITIWMVIRCIIGMLEIVNRSTGEELFLRKLKQRL